MKTVFFFLFLALFDVPAKAQLRTTPDSTKKLRIVETACGECQFHLAGKGCDLAIRIGGKAYFVDGTKIDDHGDAHAKDGFCNAVRKAEVQGELVNNRFKATYFRLVDTASGQ